MDKRDQVEGIALISQPADDCLNPRHRVSYREARRKLLQWLTDEYAHDTATVYASIICQFHRHSWVKQGGFTLAPDHDDAAAFLRARERARLHRPVSRQHRTRAESVLPVSGRRVGARNREIGHGSPGAPPERRSTWRKHLARRFGKAVDGVSRDDWGRADGFDYVSVVNASLDAGIEVGRATVRWVDVDDPVRRTPGDESPKNDDNLAVALRDATAIRPQRWLEERELYDRYDGIGRPWLARHGNPYGSKSLNFCSPGSAR
jgi:hypothetical protein